jgi:hypothetical protein
MAEPVKEILVSEPPPVLVKYLLESNEARRMTFFLLGDREKGFVPNAEMFKKFQQQLHAALQSEDHPIIVSHPFVRVLQVDIPKGACVVLNDTQLRIRVK